MLRTVPVIGGALAVLVATVVLFVWFADRGRSPEAVVVAFPEVAEEAAALNDTPEPSQEHASPPARASAKDAGEGRTVHGELERSRAPGEEPPNELDALTTATGETDGAESVPSDHASGSSEGSVEDGGDASSQGAKVDGADANSGDGPGRSPSAVEQPLEKVPPTARTVPRHGQLAWFETGVITRRSNLRENPGVESAIVARLTPGTRVQVLEPRPMFGYYRVLSEGREGWVWWLNVEPDNPDDGRG